MNTLIIALVVIPVILALVAVIVFFVSVIASALAEKRAARVAQNKKNLEMQFRSLFGY